ncbi:MAG: dihydropteroate synthase [Pyrinomonadaceae bacterium]|nr:dihydropteroate synthase [Pyrinomonadaceae bacterium]
MSKVWQTSQRRINCSDRTLIMGILNVTPDSFSDGGMFNEKDRAIKQAEKLIEEGADILDIGGESSRPDSDRVSVDKEINRVVPLIAAIRSRFDTPISVDTSKSEVAREAVSAGAEIINDISGLRFDDQIGRVARETGAGLVLMHLRGEFETMHRLEPADDILAEVIGGIESSLEKAREFGVKEDQVCVDVGIGFSKTLKQNLELIAKLDKISHKFVNYPMLVGTSRKSFIGKVLGDIPVDERLSGTVASNVISVWNGADILRVHDVKAVAEAAKVVEAIRKEL